MAKFVAVHPLKTPVTGQDIIPIANRVKTNNTPDVYWVSGWIQLNGDGKITRNFCEWDGKGAEAVCKALAKSAPELLVEGVYPMAEIHGESYR